MYCRGIRGATTVEENTPQVILDATRELLERIIAANGVRAEDVASVLFTTTPDLNAAFPAQAARELGWQGVALLCGQEVRVPEGLGKCIRVLIHWNTEKRASEIEHVYLKGAASLRPEWSRAKDEGP
jgi:chorismate mutase